MNNFTKKELILIGFLTVTRYLMVGADEATDEGTVALSHKIQDMFVNYCEHTEQYEDLNFNPIVCKKCKEIVG